MKKIVLILILITTSLYGWKVKTHVAIGREIVKEFLFDSGFFSTTDELTDRKTKRVNKGFGSPVTGGGIIDVIREKPEGGFINCEDTPGLCERINSSVYLKNQNNNSVEIIFINTEKQLFGEA